MFCQRNFNCSSTPFKHNPDAIWKSLRLKKYRILTIFRCHFKLVISLSPSKIGLLDKVNQIEMLWLRGERYAWVRHPLHQVCMLDIVKTFRVTLTHRKQIKIQNNVFKIETCITTMWHKINLFCSFNEFQIKLWNRREHLNTQLSYVSKTSRFYRVYI